MAESPDEGRKRLTQRDRAADAGERVDEYRRGDWTTNGDPADRARQQAVEENLQSRGDGARGAAPQDEPSRSKKPSRPADDEPGRRTSQ